MNSRLLFLLCASLAAALPEAAWAGSGGPSASGYTVMGLLVIIIILLFLIWKKIS
jgi:hypothetical protein